MLHDLRAKQRENTANDKLMSELKKHADRREELKTPDIMKALYKIWRGYLAERLGVTVLELEARVPGLTGPKVEWYDVMVQGEKVKLPEVVSRTGADTPTGDQPELFAKT